METSLFKIGLIGSVFAATTAACCVLPVALMLIGLGGSWLALFGAVAAVSAYIALAAALVLGVAWILAVRRRASRQSYAVLGTGTLLTFVAWGLLLNETAINDYLITLM